MPASYDPKDATILWPVGEYHATLIKVEDKTSKVKPDGTGGNPMQVWTFRAYHDDGSEQLLTDYVVIPAAVFKIKQLAVALNRKEEFEAGEFQADDQINADVILELVVEQQPGFEEKNKIKKVKGVPIPASPPPTQRPSPTINQRVAQVQSARPAAKPQMAAAPFPDVDPGLSDADIPF